LAAIEASFNIIPKPKKVVKKAKNDNVAQFNNDFMEQEILPDMYPDMFINKYESEIDSGMLEDKYAEEIASEMFEENDAFDKFNEEMEKRGGVSNLNFDDMMLMQPLKITKNNC